MPWRDRWEGASYTNLSSWQHISTPLKVLEKLAYWRDHFYGELRHAPTRVAVPARGSEHST
jgi:hypothetical protein